MYKLTKKKNKNINFIKYWAISKKKLLNTNRPKYMKPSCLQLNTKTIKSPNRKIHNKTHIQLHHISELIAIFIPTPLSGALKHEKAKPPERDKIKFNNVHISQFIPRRSAQKLHTYPIVKKYFYDPWERKAASPELACGMTVVNQRATR